MLDRNEQVVDNSAEPVAAYRRRLREYADQMERLGHLHSQLVVARRFFLGLIVCAIVLAERESWLPKVVIVGSIAGAIEFLMHWRNRVSRKRLRTARAITFYEWRLACLDGRWPGTGSPGVHYLDENHPYALDLDLFGTGGLFELLNTTCTRTGEDTLAEWLLTPATADTIRERQAAIAELRSRLDLREELALLRSEGAAGVSLAALAPWGQTGPAHIPIWVRLVAAVLALAAFAALFGFCWFGALPFVLVGVLVVAGVFALWLRPRVRLVTDPVRPWAIELSAVVGVFRLLERERFTTPYLVRLRAALDADGKAASQALARLARLVHWLNLAPPFFALLGTTQVALAIDAWRVRFGPALARWQAALSELEALCALAGYAFENPNDPFPEMATEGPCFVGTGLGHPLLSSERCVRNDVSLGDLRVLVVSGSNMSGKSTLLRTVGITAVLAMAGAPVRAVSLRLSPLAVGTTLRVQDSLQAGRSRFQAEVLRVRRLLDLAQDTPPLLFLLDELFQGTNSHDRRVGAEAVVRQLLDTGAIGLVTTHDLALTELADHLASQAANVHFVDDFVDGAMTFDYCLRQGVVPRSNALALLRAVGIVV